MNALKVIIDPKYESSIKDDPDFVLAIQLSRIVNSLRSNLRSYLNVSSNSKLMDTKDRLDLMLVHGSLLYEAINVFSSHGKRFRELKLWNEKEEEFNFFNRERGNAKSFTNVVLSKISGWCRVYALQIILKSVDATPPVQVCSTIRYSGQ